MNQKIRALIVDDESLAREVLLVMLGNDPEIEIIAECRNGKEAVAAIRKNSPDVVFLDIHMPEMDGFQVIEQIGAAQMPVTIFVTAYDKHALRAFEMHALDYLLKPFDHDRFDNTLQRVKTIIRQKKLGEISESLLAMLQDVKPKAEKTSSETKDSMPEKIAHKETMERVVVRSGGRIYFLKTEEIDWVEGSSNYLSLHIGGETHLIRETMGNFHSRLDSRKFLRIHRSTIVNIDRIKDIRPLFKGEYVITLKSGKRLKASRGYRHEIQSLLDEAR